VPKKGDFSSFKGGGDEKKLHEQSYLKRERKTFPESISSLLQERIRFPFVYWGNDSLRRRKPLQLEEDDIIGEQQQTTYSDTYRA